MRAALGTIALLMGTASAAYGIAVLGMGLLHQDPKLLRRGRQFVPVVCFAAVLAVVAMEWALLSHDFSLRYVASNGSLGTPTLFTITGLWASLEGSILLWILILSGYLVAMVRRFRARATDPVVAWATIVGLVVVLFFFALTLGPANPFRLISGVVPTDGNGPNPLLANHPLMAFHPPMLYLGYTGFTIPFAFAIAALITGRVGEDWLTDTRRATLIAWGFLSVGIVLGAWWSYEVLGWGGFWGWDPVENASLLPWLTGTAFLHSAIVQERRSMLRVWNLSLVIATFSLTILGTFLTRSGIINSVHAFSVSPIGPWLLTFFGFVCVVGIGLVSWRGDALRTPGRIDSPISREAAFLGNNVLFAGFAFVVLLGTVFPLISEALTDEQLSVGEPYFERMTSPIGLCLLFLMAVAPALPWRAVSGEVVRQRLIVPSWVGAAALVAAVALGARGLGAVLAYGLAAFAAAAMVRQAYIGLRARRSNFGEAAPVAFVRMVRSNPRLYGGLCVHAGVVLIALVFAASATAGTKQQLRLARGESASVAGYRFTFVDTNRSETRQKITVSARIRIQRGGNDLGTYAPAISTFPGAMTGIGTPSVRTGLREDVYLTLVSSPTERGRITIEVRINPMIIWLWIGGLLIAVGTIIAVLPSIRRSRGPAAVEVAEGVMS